MPIPLLSLVLLTPLAGMLVLLLLPSGNKKLIRLWANVAGLLSFLVSVPLVLEFDKTLPGFQFTEDLNWSPFLGVRYMLGLDGISLLLVMLTTVMSFLAILCSWSAVEDRLKSYYPMLLLLETGMLGVFLALDFFLFYVFWEVVLVPMYFLIGVWGGPRKLYAAIKFFLYTLTGSVLMLVAMLVLYFAHQSSSASTHSTFRNCSERVCPSRRSSGCSGCSSSASQSRCRCSLSTPGCRTRIPKLPRPAPCCWRRSCSRWARMASCDSRCRSCPMLPAA